MRSNYHVYVAGLHAFGYFLLLLRRTKPRQQLDLHRERGEATTESVEMLVSKNRRGRKHRRLLSFHHGFESCAHGNLGLAIADVATEQTVHRRGLLHILLYVFNCRLLVGRQHVFKTILKFLLPRSIGRERITADQFSLLVHTQK